MSSGGAATGVVLGILMAFAIGGVEASTADLDSTATETPSDLPTAVDGGTDSTELGLLCNHTLSCDYGLAFRDDATQRTEIGGGLTAIRAAEPDAGVPFFRPPGGSFSPELVDVAQSWR